MKAVIKIGGTLLDDPQTRHNLSAQLAAVARTVVLTVVHGGGKQVTGYLEAQGIQSRFVDGLRVSSPDVIDAVSSVIAGRVNTQLVSSLIGAGARPVGLSGVDGQLTRAEQLRPELGFVGRPVATDPALLDLLTGAQYLPVVACVAADSAGTVFNVNADQMAVSCASGWRADRLVFLTDVEGVRGPNGTIAAQLTRPEALHLIASGVAHGGMQAKLEAAITGIENGIGEVVIALGRETDICKRLLAGELLGTRIVLQQPS